ncbi:MAG: GerMN domain-containing protein [Lachnospirales bacterium]
MQNKKTKNIIFILVSVIIVIILGYFLFKTFFKEDSLNIISDNNSIVDENNNQNNESDSLEDSFGEELYPYETFDMKTFLNFQPNTIYVYKNQNSDELFQMFFSHLEEEKMVGVINIGDISMKEMGYTTKDEFVIYDLKASYDLRSMLLGVHSEEIADITTEATAETLVILKAPFEVGNTWESRGSTFTIDEVTEEYVVVTGANIEGVSNKIYFKEGLGIYKFIEYTDGVEETYELFEKQEDTGLIINSQFSLINDEMLLSEYVDVEVELNTNETIVDVLNELYNNIENEKYSSPLPKGAKVLSVTKGDDDDYVHVDFSKEFQTNKNWGSGFEAECLSSIANTFCELYKVEKVKLTVEGESYESGHIYLEDDMIMR